MADEVAAQEKRDRERAHAIAPVLRLAKFATMPPKFRSELEEGLADLCAMTLAAFRRIERLERETAELKAAPLTYRGVWKMRTTYAAGTAITYGGSMWVATEPTDSKPGSDDSWQLAVKRGRDAK
jgi:hypothetical protein